MPFLPVFEQQTKALMCSLKLLIKGRDQATI